MNKNNEKKRIVIDTQKLLELTGWDIDHLMEVMNVPVIHRQRIIDAIRIDEKDSK